MISLLAIALSGPAAALDAPAASAASYNPIGKRDPFRGFLPREVDLPEGSLPLQRYEVDDLSLIGLSWGETPYAMLATPSGEAHVVELGAYVGKSWGKVTQITSAELEITEEYLASDGALVSHQIVLSLPVDAAAPN